MGDLVGIIKELREGEKVSFDSKAVVPIVLTKEVNTKGLVRRSQKQVPTALMYANLYATNQRVLFLVFYQMQAEGSQKRNMDIRLAEITNTWFAISVDSVERIEPGRLDSSGAKEVRQFLQRSGEQELFEQSGVELVPFQSECDG